MRLRSRGAGADSRVMRRRGPADGCLEDELAAAQERVVGQVHFVAAVDAVVVKVHG